MDYRSFYLQKRKLVSGVVMKYFSSASDVIDVYTTWNIEMFAEIHAVQNILFARLTE